MFFKKGKKRLGEILIEQGVIDKDALERALEKQKNEGGLLGAVLLKMGLVSEEDIVIALANQFNFPYLPVQNCDINPKIVKLVPEELVRKHLFVPIDKIHNVLTVIMVDPSNEFARKDIEEATGLRVQALVGTVSEITNTIRKIYHIKGSLIETSDPSGNLSRSFEQATKQNNNKNADNE